MVNLGSSAFSPIRCSNLIPDLKLLGKLVGLVGFLINGCKQFVSGIVRVKNNSFGNIALSVMLT